MVGDEKRDVGVGAKDRPLIGVHYGGRGVLAKGALRAGDDDIAFALGVAHKSITREDEVRTIDTQDTLQTVQHRPDRDNDFVGAEVADFLRRCLMAELSVDP